jgi:hypothetical protein
MPGVSSDPSSFRESLSYRQGGESSDAVGFFEILVGDTGTVDDLTNYVCSLAKLELV